MRVRYRGLLYRALNPVYARTPLSGEGAARYGGRFNRKGRPALYTALSPETAMREANQVGTLQPTILVAYRADIQPIFDGTDSAALAEHGTDTPALADPSWRTKMLAGGAVPTQDLSEALIDAGFAGLLIPSYAKGARQAERNLVLWRWHAPPDAWLEISDDEGRLDRLPRADL